MGVVERPDAQPRRVRAERPHEREVRPPGPDGEGPQGPVPRDLCGLAYEALAHDSIFVEQPHDVAVADLLRHASTAALGKILDPTGVDDLTAEWDDDQRRRYVDRFAALSVRADEALRLRADGSEPAAVEVWRSVFGETGTWPTEDAPHGDGKAPHRIRTAAVRQAQRDWART